MRQFDDKLIQKEEQQVGWLIFLKNFVSEVTVTENAIHFEGAPCDQT